MKAFIIGKVIFLFIIASVFLFLNYYIGSSSAQQNPNGNTKQAVKSPFGNVHNEKWFKVCKKSKDNLQSCNVSQTLIKPIKNHKPLRIASISVQSTETTPKVDKDLLKLIVPLGAVLKEGVSLSFDEKNDIRVPFSFCINDGCHAMAIIKPDLINKFKNNKSANIRYLTIANKTLLFKFSLDGFTKAFDSPPTSVSQKISPSKKR